AWTGALEWIARVVPKPVVRGVVKGDSVFFGFALDMGGQQIVINGAAAMKDNDNMSGLLDVAGMGGFPFTAVRQK
ncbi:MAG: hypothetical protein ACK6DP_06740, partial [Gemmatimonas sp.]|uniref:hypothetical protein n=1 Tax=Gemmatimonas sp. TaxID=1962908 RepID=UPI00391F76E9